MNGHVSQPAFPRNFPTTHDGMTLRDYFAATALAMLGNPTLQLVAVGVAGPTEVADAAYKLADAMLAERSKDVREG